MLFIITFTIMCLSVSCLGINIILNREISIKKCDKTGGICSCL